MPGKVMGCDGRRGGRVMTEQFPRRFVKSSLPEPADPAAAGRCRGPSSCAPRALPPAAPGLRGDELTPEDVCELLCALLSPPDDAALEQLCAPASASGCGVD